MNHVVRAVLLATNTGEVAEGVVAAARPKATGSTIEVRWGHSLVHDGESLQQISAVSTIFVHSVTVVHVTASFESSANLSMK